MKFRHMILSALVCAVPVVAVAAEVSPDISTNYGKRKIKWEGVATGDTTAPAFWNGGRGIVFVSGTQAAAQFSIKFDPEYTTSTINFQSVDEDAAPDGLLFNSSGLIESGTPGFELPPGHMRVDFLSAGNAEQDLDIMILQTERK